MHDVEKFVERRVINFALIFVIFFDEPSQFGVQTFNGDARGSVFMGLCI